MDGYMNWIEWSKEKPAQGIICVFFGHNHFDLSAFLGMGTYEIFSYCGEEIEQISAIPSTCGCDGVEIEEITHWMRLKAPEEK